MANHVFTSINITGLTPETIKILDDRLSKIEFGESVAEFFPDAEYTYEFFNEHIGTKWCNLEDYSSYGDEVIINLTSAWAYPETFIHKMHEVVEKSQENFTTFVSYEDEMPNFAGAEVYLDGDLQDATEYDCDEIMEGIESIDARCYELLMKEQEDEELSEEEEVYLMDTRHENIQLFIDNFQEELLGEYR